MQLPDVIAKGGGVKALSSALGLHHASVIGWRKAGRIPAERVREVSRLTGIPPHELRPDLYDPPAMHGSPAPQANA